MTVATRLARHAVQIRAREGEPVTLPSGAGVAVVELPGATVELGAAGTRTAGRVSVPHQMLPVLHLVSADAAALRERDAVTVRGVEYLVVSLTPDGAGMTAVELMRPGAEPQPRPEWRQWR